MLVALFGRSVMSMSEDEIKRQLLTAFQAITGFDKDGLKLIPLYILAQKTHTKLSHQDAGPKLSAIQTLFPHACFQQSTIPTSTRQQ